MTSYQFLINVEITIEGQISLSAVINTFEYNFFELLVEMVRPMSIVHTGCNTQVGRSHIYDTKETITL